MSGEVLRRGFALAHRKLGLIFLDLLWKAIWCAVIFVALALIAGWFGSQLQNIQWQETGVPALNGLLATAALRQFLGAHRTELFWMFLALIIFSALLWMVFEAFCRRRIVHVVAGFSPRSPIGDERGLKPATTFRVFFASALIKFLLLTTTGFILALIVFGQYLATPISQWRMLWLETRGATIAGLVAFIGVAFLLTILDTLLRSDAIELLGVDLIRVSGVIGTLLLFEAMVGGSVLIVIVAGFLNVSRGIEAIVMLVVSIFGVILLNLFHSYLLLVRFSAVDIMRRNVVGI